MFFVCMMKKQNVQIMSKKEVNKTILDELIILTCKMKGKYSTLLELHNSAKG